MEWIEGSNTFSVSTAQTQDTPSELFQNDLEPINDRTIVDGYVTIITDTDDLCQVRLFAPCPNFTVAADLGFAIPDRRDPISWYWFNCARGPLIFRIRSKRTFGAQQELWMTGNKLRAVNVTNIHVGWQFLLAP